MSDKVVRLAAPLRVVPRGEDFALPPNPHVIKALEQVLEMAKEGKVWAVAIGGYGPDGEVVCVEPGYEDGENFTPEIYLTIERMRTQFLMSTFGLDATDISSS